MTRTVVLALVVLASTVALPPGLSRAQQTDGSAPPAAGTAQQPASSPQQPVSSPQQPASSPQPTASNPQQPVSSPQPTAGSTQPSASTAQPADASALLTSVALTQADLPAGLTFDQDHSGARNGDDGSPTYMATFIGNGSGPLPIMGVVNIVSETPDAAAGIDRLADRFRTGLGGTPTEIAAPGLGDASRAFSVTRSAPGGVMTANSVFVALRRAGVVAGVMVTSIGDTPQTDLALRLAQSVDQRIAAALRPGT